MSILSEFAEKILKVKLNNYQKKCLDATRYVRFISCCRSWTKKNQIIFDYSTEEEAIIAFKRLKGELVKLREGKL